MVMAMAMAMASRTRRVEQFLFLSTGGKRVMECQIGRHEKRHSRRIMCNSMRTRLMKGQRRRPCLVVSTQFPHDVAGDTCNHERDM